jgi:hypothetical protein
MNDGPLRGEVFALYGAKGVDFNFVLADGRVAVCQTSLERESNLMYFVGIDPLAKASRRSGAVRSGSTMPRTSMGTDPARQQDQST